MKMETEYNRRRMAAFASVLLIFIASVVGIAILVRGLLGRQARIEETRERITDLLSELDPVARLQVAQYVVEQELDKV